MKTKTLILSFLMTLFCSVSFGQNTNPDWGEFNYHNYATNMEIIAKISLDGDVQSGTNLKIAAYCGNERRSEVVNIQSTPVGDLVQLQVFGVKNFPSDNSGQPAVETITFKLYDGTSMFASNTSVTFEANHVSGDLFNPETIEFKSVAKIGEVIYATLPAAVDAAQSGETVVLTKTTTGAGVVINKNVTIDFAGYTYTANEGVGSTGTETLGFQILKGNNVTLKNGTFVAGEGIKMLVQNYANLTVEDMTLNGESELVQYVLSNNCGTTNIQGNTNIKTHANGVAFDVYDYSSAGYAVPTVNVNTTGKITGEIEVSESIEDNLNISGGTFTTPIQEAWCAEGYIPTTNTDGTYGVKRGKYVARNTTTGQGYETLVEAVEAANADETVKLLADAEGAGLKINKNVTVDFGGKTYTINQAVGSQGTESQGFQLLKNNNVTLTNGKVAIASGINVKWMFNAYANVTLKDIAVDCANMAAPAPGEKNYVLVANNGGGATPTITYSNVAIENFNGNPLYLDPTTTLKADAGLNIETIPGYKVVYADDTKIYSVQQLRAYFKSGAYARYAADKPREHFSINLYDVYAKESLVVKVYHNETLLLTTTYREYDLEDIDKTNPRYPVATTEGKGLTVNNVVSGKEAGSWLNEWAVAPNVENVPNKFEVYVDGVLTNTYDGTQNSNAGFSTVENLNTYLAFEGVYKEASVTNNNGTTYYMTFDKAFAASGEGDKITAMKPVVISENKTYDFTGRTIVGDEVYPIFRIQDNANVTVKGGNISNDDYIFVLGASDGSSAGNLTIESGTYEGLTTVASVTKGLLTIKGGEYKVKAGEYGSTYLINCIDANYNADPRTANAEIKGGTFHGFDPENNAAEGAGTNFCADGFISDANADGTIFTVREGVYVAQVGNVKYETLQAAVDAAQPSATVTLLDNTTGAGVVINKNVTIDFGGFIYTVNQAVGSTGTETLGFQILKDNTVTLKNGTLTSTTPVVSDKEVKMLVQNYANLTLTDMNLVDGTNHILYVLSNNSGESTIDGKTSITTDAVAFDVYDYTSAGYAVPKVNVNTTGKITGEIEVSESIEDNLNISGGTFTTPIQEAWCANGYIPVDNGDGTYTVKVGKFIAQTETGAKYETLQDAVNAGTEVTLLSDATGAGVVINKDVTINFGGFTYSFNEGVGSTGTKTLGMQILQGKTVTLKNGKLKVAEGCGELFGMLVQNYANLTVEDMTLDGDRLDRNDYSYVLSNNSGTVNIIGATNIYANTTENESHFAFDVCKYSSYEEPIVNVNTTGTIKGAIEVTTTSQGNLNISGGKFTTEIEEAWCADTYIPVKEGEYWTVKRGTFVARNITTGQGYESLKAAVETANAGETIKLLQDIKLEGGYADATEGLRIELKGDDYSEIKYLTIDGNGKTINCGNFEKGIRIYNEGTIRRIDINNVTIVNDNTNGRCIDTRSGNINLKINGSQLIATNGNSQPLTIGGTEKIHRVMLDNTTINAGNSGYGVISFVSNTVDIQTANNTKIDGYAAFYVKGDNSEVRLNLGRGTYTGKNIHSGDSNTFGAVVLEGNNIKVKMIGTNPTVKAIAGGTAPQAAFLVRGENNTITIESETAQVVTEGDNAYWAMIDKESVETTTITYHGTQMLPAAEARGFQFMSLEEAIRFANAEGTVTVVNDNTMTATVVVEKDLTLDLNGKTVSYSSTAAAPAIRVLADVTVKNGTIETTNNEGNNYCFIVGQGNTAGKLTIESGLYDASNGGTSVASVTRGELNIVGGEFKSKEYNGDYRYLINCMDASYANGTAVVSITGGTFHGFNPENNLAEGANTNFCQEGYIAVYDADNDTYTVKQGVWRAQIGDVKYETVGAATSAAQDGDVVYLLGNVNDGEVTVDLDKAKKITIDLGGYTYTSTGTAFIAYRDGTELTITNGTVNGNGAAGGTLRVTYKAMMILGKDLTVNAGPQATAIVIQDAKFYVNPNTDDVIVNGGIDCIKVAENALEVSIASGTYTEDVNEWCAPGYMAVNNGDGTWTVKPVQSMELSEGWNWFSSYIDINGETGLAKLQNALVTNGIQIKGNNSYTNYTDNEEQPWFGTLTSTSVKEMYMIKMSANHNFELEGEIVNPAEIENAISLQSGWNWIGYQLAEQLGIADALANITPNHGDRIKSHLGFSQYYKNESYTGWWGTLNNMTPGVGYMYYNAGDATPLTYSYPAEGSRSEVRANVTSENNYWVPTSSQYASNMNIIAVLDVEDEDYEIAAFVGGEVRGSARPIYVEPLDAYMFFLTIHGEGVEEMTFKCYDLATGEELSLNDRINYSDNAVLGSIEEPYKFNATLGIGENAASAISIYPNPATTGNEINLAATCDTVEVFNALGVKIAEYQNVDTIDAIETAGVYMIRVTNNGNVQNCRLVVK